MGAAHPIYLPDQPLSLPPLTISEEAERAVAAGPGDPAEDQEVSEARAVEREASEACGVSVEQAGGAAVSVVWEACAAVSEVWAI